MPLKLLPQLLLFLLAVWVLGSCQVWMGRGGGDSWWQSPAVCQNLGANYRGCCEGNTEAGTLAVSNLKSEECTLRFWQHWAWLLAGLPLRPKCCLILQDQEAISQRREAQDNVRTEVGREKPTLSASSWISAIQFSSVYPVGKGLELPFLTVQPSSNTACLPPDNLWEEDSWHTDPFTDVRVFTEINSRVDGHS